MRSTLFVVALLIFFELAYQIGLIKTLVLPSPVSVLRKAIELILNGTLIKNTFYSLGRVFSGFCIAAVLAISLGIILAFLYQISGFALSFFELLRPIPPIAWIPLAILWFGLGTKSAVFIVFIGAFFPIFLNVYSGLKAVSQQQINAARSLGASFWLLTTEVLIPAALPNIFIGIRVGLGMAWMSVIAAEMVGAQEGLGYAIQLNRIMLETEAVVVNIIMIGLIGWGMNQVIIFLERRLTPWNQNRLIVRNTGKNRGG